MRQVTYTMHFRGQVSRSTDASPVLKTTSSGTSCTLETVVTGSGVETTLHAVPGDLAFLESQVRMTGSDAFEGSAVLTFGDDSQHSLRFSTLGAGHMQPSGLPGLMAGTAGWRVDGGAGQFASASGFITSTFTLSASGELSEYQSGLLFLPD